MNSLDKLLKKYTDGDLRSVPMILVLIEMLRMERRATRRLIDDLRSQTEALEEMLSECTGHGELDSSLFNSFMEHAIKSK